MEQSWCHVNCPKICANNGEATRAGKKGQCERPIVKSRPTSEALFLLWIWQSRYDADRWLEEAGRQQHHLQQARKAWKEEGAVCVRLKALKLTLGWCSAGVLFISEKRKEVHMALWSLALVSWQTSWCVSQNISLISRTQGQLNNHEEHRWSLRKPWTTFKILFGKKHHWHK